MICLEMVDIRDGVELSDIRRITKERDIKDMVVFIRRTRDKKKDEANN